MNILLKTIRHSLLLVLSLAAGSLHAQTTSAIATTTTLSVSPSASGASGTEVTLAANVADVNGPVLHGSVSFYDGTRLLKTMQVVATDTAGFIPGTATLKTLSLAIGSHSVTATFNPTNSDKASSSTAQSLTVTGPQRTVTALVSSGTTNGSYALTSSVIGGNAPSGYVSFNDLTTSTTLGTSLASPASASTPAFVAEPSITCAAALAADFNGDGIDDLITTSNYCSALPSSALGGFLGNGDGTFQPVKVSSAISTEVYGYPYVGYPYIADFNNDGVLDVFAGGEIYLGLGDGTFTLKSSSLSPYGSTTPLIADFNGDGILDLGNYQSGLGGDYNGDVGVLDLYLGNGDGTFNESRFTQVLDSKNIYAAATALAPNSSTLILYGTGGVAYISTNAGSYLTDSEINLTTAVPASIFIQDMNGDGLPDILAETASTGSSQSQLLVFLQNVDGTFTARSPVSLGTSPSGTDVPISILDFNHDGYPDIMNFVPDTTNGSLASDICLFYGTSTGQLLATPTCYTLSAPINIYPVIGNFLGFGTSDLLTTSSTTTNPYSGLLLIAPAFSSSTSLANITVPNADLQSVVAAYPGDSNFAASTSSPVTLDNRLTTSLKVTTNSLGTYSSALQGTSIAFTIQAISTGSTPTGTVQLYDHGVALGSPISLASGTATYTTATLAVGNHSITGVYSGDGSNQIATSSAVSLQIVSTGTAQVCVLYSGPATVNQGTPVQATGEVTQKVAGAAPTGTVAIESTYSSSGLSGESGWQTLNNATPPSTSFTINTATAPLGGGGVQKLNLEYSGDANYPGSNSQSNTGLTACNPPTIDVLGATTATLSNVSSPVKAGTSFALTGQLQYEYPKAIALSTPTGTLQLLDSGKVIATRQVDQALPASPVFTLNTVAAPLMAGTHSFTFGYTGDSSWLAATSTVSSVTVQAVPTITLTSNLASGGNLYKGAAAQFTATVADIGNGPTPTGTVQFYDNATAIGAPVPILTGIGTFSSSQFAVGAQSITAVYSGDTNYPSVTSSPFTFKVVSTTTDTLTVIPAASTIASGATLTVGVVVNRPPITGAPQPTGTMTLKLDGAVLTAATITSGYPTFSINTVTAPLNQGAHALSATYSGDSVYPASTAPAVNITVTGNLPKFALTSNAASYINVVQGTPLTFTATVGVSAIGLPVPTGTVQFNVDGASAGSPASLLAGAATYTTSALTAGSHSITAAYSGNGTYTSTTTNGTAAIVTQGTDTMALSLTGATSVASGVPITLSGTLSVASLGPAPSGTITLLDNASAIATTTLSGKAPFAFSFMINTTTQPLATGVHSFSLKYAGSTEWKAATSSTQSVTVGKDAGQIILASSEPTSPVGSSVTFTATVNAATGLPAPTGTVQFLDGTTALSAPVTLTSGSASYTTSTLVAGSHSITAEYSGDTNYASATSAIVNEEIQSITSSVGSPTVRVAAGGSVSETIAVTSTGGLNDTTTFACSSGLPQGSTCSFSPVSVTGSGTTTLTITTTGTTSAVRYPNHWLAATGSTALASLLCFLAPRRRRKWAQMLGVLLFVASILTGCGGGGGTSSGGSTNSTPTGTYIVTVTTTSGSGPTAITEQVKFQLIVT